jgi:chromosome segregation ATPase
MNTKNCRQCGTIFEPRRVSQQYCSPSCSRRHRDSEWQDRRNTQTSRRLTTQLAAAVTENRVILEDASAKCQRQMAEARQTARNQLKAQANQYEREAEDLRTRLRQLATINVDMACQIPELKAQITELQMENARLFHSQHADYQELMQIAGRLFELSSRLGLPLDKATSEIFHRRGWRTDTLVSER